MSGTPSGDEPAWRCPACGRRAVAAAPLFVFAPPPLPLRVYACPCGMRHTDFARAARTPDLYDGSYYNHPRYEDTAGRKAYIDHLAEFLQAHEAKRGPGGRRLLDVGCATGDFVAWALENGWDAEGIDLSAAAVARGQERGLPLRVASLGSVSLAVERYDVVTLWDVLEHLVDPTEALRACGEALAPGGILFLKTVSCTSLLDTMATLLYRVSGGWLQGPLKRMYVPGHLYYFTGEALRACLVRAGFEVLAVEGRDTPPAALFSHPLPRILMASIQAAQRVTGRTYEILALCRKPSAVESATESGDRAG